MNKTVFCLIFFCCISAAVPTQASECAAPLSVKEAYANASRVFIGKVTQANEHLRIIDTFRVHKDIQVSFAVSKILKGAQEDKITVYTSSPYDMGMGYPFEEGKEYLVFTSFREGVDYTTLCTRTKLLSEASEDVEVLKKTDQ